MTGDVGGIFWKFFMFLLIKGFIFAYFREKFPLVENMGFHQVSVSVW